VSDVRHITHRGELYLAGDDLVAAFRACETDASMRLGVAKTVRAVRETWRQVRGLQAAVEIIETVVDAAKREPAP
jgi:hypothetical protein